MGYTGLVPAISCDPNEDPVRIAPALQEFFGDYRSVCQYRRVSGLFVQPFQDTACPPSWRCKHRLPGNGTELDRPFKR